MNFSLEELCIEITGKCFMNCLHCSSSCHSGNNYFLSFKKIKEILNSAKSLGTKILEISGGEPLLHPDINKIVAIAKPDFEVRLYTSGFTGLHSGITQKQLAHFSSLGLDRIIFNLQGACPETHEFITRTTGSFDSVISSLRRAKDEGLWVGTHFVPIRPNYKSLLLLADLCTKYEVNELAILRFVSQGRGKLNCNLLDLNQAEFKELLLDVILSKQEYKDVLKIRTGCPMNFCSLIDKTIEPVRCKAGISTLLVSFDGKVKPCPAFKHANDFYLESIHEKTLVDIWNNSPGLFDLREFDYRQIIGCHDCKESIHCQGRCIAQRYYRYGNIYQGPDPLCPKQKEITHEEQKLLIYSSS